MSANADWNRLAAEADAWQLFSDDASEGFCRVTLSRYAGIEPALWRFRRNSRGKPSIAAPAAFRSLRFNLTRTRGLLVCLVSRAGDVGVDAEETSRTVDVEQVARHFFSRSEQELLAKMPADEREARLFEQWVLKEAYAKGVGTGLAFSPERLTIDLRGDGRAAGIRQWRFSLHRPTPNHVIAAAVREPAGAPVKVNWLTAGASVERGVGVVRGRIPELGLT